LSRRLVVFLFGIWDDRTKDCPLGPKLIGQFIAATILILLGVQVRFHDCLLLTTGKYPHI
jgi:UDP-N-acetylmuramyl pentapeptide phosphotransferase/UDP-N-acetylglucosamine-1-phosphate transferase